MLWGIYSAIYELLVHRCEKCVEIKGDYVWKIAKLFYFCHLKKSWSGRKLLDPTTYLVKTISKYHIDGRVRRPSTQLQAGVAEVGLASPVFFSLTWTTLPCHPVNDMAFILNSCHLPRSVSQWEWRISSIARRSTALPFHHESLKYDHIRARSQAGRKLSGKHSSSYSLRLHFTCPAFHLVRRSG